MILLNSNLTNKLNKKANIRTFNGTPIYSSHNIQLIWGNDNYLYVKVDETYAVKIKGFCEITNE